MANVTDAELITLDGERVDLHAHYGTRPSGVGGAVTPGDIVSWGGWSMSPRGKWFVPTKLSGSDYSGGFVNRANFEAFMEDADPNDLFSVELQGGHNTYGVALLIEDTPREVWDMLAALEQYPSVDDERVSKLEAEATYEAWERWAKDEYKKLWAEHFTEDYFTAEELEEMAMPEGWVDQVSDDDWWEHFETCRENAGEHWEQQGDTREMSVDVGRVFAGCDSPSPWVDPGLVQAPTPPAPVAERPPRGRWTAGQIREFKARGLRQGYDFNPAHPAQAHCRHSEAYRSRDGTECSLCGAKKIGGRWRHLSPDWFRYFAEGGARPPGDVQYVRNARSTPIEEALDNDPYAGLVIQSKDTDEERDMLVRGTVMANVAYDQSPHERAMLVVRLPMATDQYYLVCWWETRSGWYTVTVFDLSTVMVSAGGDTDPRVRQRAGMSHDSWHYVKEGLDKKDPRAFAVYYRWWDDAGLSPRLWETAKLSALAETRENVPYALLRRTYVEVFDLYAGDVPTPGPAITTTGVAVPERKPRFNWSPGQVREFMARGLRPGYDFNPAPDVADWSYELARSALKSDGVAREHNGLLYVLTNYEDGPPSSPDEPVIVGAYALDERAGEWVEVGMQEFSNLQTALVDWYAVEIDQDEINRLAEASVATDSERSRGPHRRNPAGGLQRPNIGRAKKLGLKPEDFDSVELAVGTEHELEHTQSRRKAQQVAMDHLAEFWEKAYEDAKRRRSSEEEARRRAFAALKRADYYRRLVAAGL